MVGGIVGVRYRPAMADPRSSLALPPSPLVAPARHALRAAWDAVPGWAWRLLHPVVRSRYRMARPAPWPYVPGPDVPGIELRWGRARGATHRGAVLLLPSAGLHGDVFRVGLDASADQLQDAGYDVVVGTVDPDVSWEALVDVVLPAAARAVADVSARPALHVVAHGTAGAPALACLGRGVAHQIATLTLVAPVVPTAHAPTARALAWAARLTPDGGWPTSSLGRWRAVFDGTAAEGILRRTAWSSLGHPVGAAVLGQLAASSVDGEVVDPDGRVDLVASGRASGRPVCVVAADLAPWASLAREGVALPADLELLDALTVPDARDAWLGRVLAFLASRPLRPPPVAVGGLRRGWGR